MWQAEFKLYLYPVNQGFCISAACLCEILKNEGFTGSILEGNRFSTGSKFLSHLTFMGCSPDIELEPQKDKPYCYIEIENYGKPSFIFGSNLKKARCYHCKQDIEEPSYCPHCQQKLNPTKINWRKTAFIATTSIMIANIYELEAIPNDQFLDTLENKTGVKWKAAYIRKASK